jgi:hypothetical protein
MTAVGVKGAIDAGNTEGAVRRGRGTQARAAWATRAAFLACAVTLFFAYLGQSRTMATMSDGASQALQAWAMLHGNLLLHGWSLSDVSFYTTELPEYMLVEVAKGLGPDVVHVAAALTYTLLVLLAAVLAKGRATGREGAVRALVAAGIMLAPALGSLNTTFVVLAYPDHTGTQVPLLATWLLLDRVRPRWWVPIAVGAALAWVQVADSMALYEAALPLLAVCAVRIYRMRGPIASRWYEWSLAAGALLSAVVATQALRAIREAGGFAVRTPAAGFARAAGLDLNIWTKAEHILVLFGADFFGLPLTGAIMPLVHLVGVGLATGGAVAAARRFFRADDLALEVLTASFAMVLVAFTFGFRLGAWEAVALLPIGAVLAGRLLASRLIDARLVPALAAVLACYGLFLAHNASRPAPFSPNQRVAAWLAARHLRYGLASYWEASSVTVDSGGYVEVRPVRTAGDQLVLTHWNAAASWYDPRLHDARFVIFRHCTGCLSLSGLRGAFGPPAGVYRVVNYLVLVWHKNLLRGPFVSEPQVSWDILAADGVGRTWARDVGHGERPGESVGAGGVPRVRQGRPDRHDAGQAVEATGAARPRGQALRNRRALR